MRKIPLNQFGKPPGREPCFQSRIDDCTDVSTVDHFPRNGNGRDSRDELPGAGCFRSILRRQVEDLPAKLGELIRHKCEIFEIISFATLDCRGGKLMISMILILYG